MVGTEYVDRATDLFGCEVRKLPISYLGLPLRTLRLMVSDMQERRDSRGRWLLRKKQYLFKRGKLVLIKCTLSNLPVHFSILSIPKKVRIKLRRINGTFCGHNREEKDILGELGGRL